METRIATTPYNPDIAWLLGEADSALGCRGTLQSTIGALERGGAAGSPVDLEAIVDLRRQRGDVQRWRSARAAWRAVGPNHQATLLAYYTPGQMPPQCRAELGRLAGLVLHLADPAVVARVWRACHALSQQPTGWRETPQGRQAAGTLVGPLKTALASCQAAHDSWEAASRARVEAWAD